MPSPDLSLLALSSVELRQRIGRKEVSPVELLEAALARIEVVNPAVNAVTGTCIRRARAEAKAAEKSALSGDDLGPLHGLPTGIKDLEETGGLLTTYGSPLFKDFVPEHDNVMVARVRNAGAIVVAKTNVPEFGAGANSRNAVWGATGNPFNPELNAGGSSGGSAVALATDMLPVCTGSDTGGSLRIPGAINGVVGFRPSPGFVPHERRSLGWSAISVLGPMGRTVGDTRQLFAVQAGAHAVDPLTWHRGDLSVARPVDLGRLRVAWTEDFGQCPAESGIRQTMRARMKAMGHLFKSCSEVKMDLGEADRCFDVVRAISFVQRYQKDYESKRESLGPNIRANYEMGAKMSLADVAWAQAEQTRIYRRFQELYSREGYDLVVAPTVGASPRPWTTLYLEEIDGTKLKNYYHWLAMTYVITLATNPAISIPCGVDHKGMPFGLQVIGPYQSDAALLDAAEAMEAAFARSPGLGRPKPDLARLAKPTPALKSIVTSPPARADMA